MNEKYLVWLWEFFVSAKVRSLWQVDHDYDILEYEVYREIGSLIVMLLVILYVVHLPSAASDEELILVEWLNPKMGSACSLPSSESSQF